MDELRVYILSFKCHIIQIYIAGYSPNILFDQIGKSLSIRSSTIRSLIIAILACESNSIFRNFASKTNSAFRRPLTDEMEISDSRNSTGSKGMMMLYGYNNCGNEYRIKIQLNTILLSIYTSPTNSKHKNTTISHNTECFTPMK